MTGDTAPVFTTIPQEKIQGRLHTEDRDPAELRTGPFVPLYGATFP
ncbi:hypothetical protein [Streptomyces olivochromogenes]|nr:hypothetical protein [Streptomyces olivochromogenes]MCF3133829.1 hypothetical protein [Streptomyces olivochromogenes]